MLRNGEKVKSSKLSINTKSKAYPIVLLGGSYTYQDQFDLLTKDHYFDIVDFIPDTNMKENEFTIEIPNGKIVDWDESKKQNKIVLKDKQLTYEEICDKLEGMIDIPLFDTPSEEGNALVVNEHYLECFLAKNKLATVAKYLNDGWKPSDDSDIFILVGTQTGISVFEVANGSCASDCGSIWFKSGETAQQAIEILGEETIKLALKQLGI